MSKFIIICFILSFNVFAEVISISVKNYEQAKKSSDFVKFESESTKFGFITTDFDGYAKAFKVVYDKDLNKINNISVSIDSRSFDTDSESRDEKLHTKIINSQIFSEIIFTANDSIELKVGKSKLTGVLTIKKIVKESVLDIEIKRNGDAFIILGKTNFGLKAYQIPDPSIAIASVRDRFDVAFQISIK
jgi:polyisoprenoid-binding protein YceI